MREFLMDARDLSFTIILFVMLGFSYFVISCVRATETVCVPSHVQLNKAKYIIVNSHTVASKPFPVTKIVYIDRDKIPFGLRYK